jgi:hypothetical protein
MIREMLGALRPRPVLRQLPRRVEEPRTFPLHGQRACLGDENLQIRRTPRQEYTR